MLRLGCLSPSSKVTWDACIMNLLKHPGPGRCQQHKNSIFYQHLGSSSCLWVLFPLTPGESGLRTSPLIQTPLRSPPRTDAGAGIPPGCLLLPSFPLDEHLHSEDCLWPVALWMHDLRLGHLSTPFLLSFLLSYPGDVVRVLPRCGGMKGNSSTEQSNHILVFTALKMD